MIHGFDVYRTYLAMKLHFSSDKFDFFQYDGKVNAKEETYQSRNDFYFFETLARKHTEQEIKEFMLASFVAAENPSKVWIGEDFDAVVEHMESTKTTFNNLFEAMGGHPPLLKLYVKRQLHLETLIILDMVLGYVRIWDKEMRDPLWETLSFKIKKYKPFLSIPSKKYKALLLDKLT